MPTLGASLRGGEPAVNLDQFPAIPFALVFQLPNQFTPTGVANRQCQFRVLHHVLHSQVFNGNRLVFTHQSSRQLVKEIFTSIGNLFVNSGNFQPRFIAVIRAFLFTRQCLVSLFQSLVFSSKHLGVIHLLACTQGNQTVNPQVNADFQEAHRQGFNASAKLSNHLHVHQQTDKPLPRRGQFHCDGGGLNPIRELSAPSYRQGFRTLSQKYLTIPELECRLGEFSTASIALLLEVWVFRPTRKEVGEGFLKVAQSLLQGNTTDFVEKRQFFLLLPLSQHCRRFRIPDSLLSFVPGLSSLSQGAVVDKTSTPHCSPKQMFLLWSGVKAISEGFLRHNSHYSVSTVKAATMAPFSRAPIPPCPRTAGFLGGFR